jgi:hypothetical protein
MVQKSEGAGHASPHSKMPGVKTPPPPPSLPASPPAPTAPTPIGRLSAARAAVQQFLSSELGAREVRITKVIPGNHNSEGWSVEAEILVPNLEVKMLGLPLTQEVLEREHYLLELEADLSVRSYEHVAPDED